MIIPIKNHSCDVISTLKIDDEILLVKEKDNINENNAIGAYNHLGQQVGYISSRSTNNENVFNKIMKDDCIGMIWSISRNHILVEISTD
jgi:hypothetical protein